MAMSYYAMQKYEMVYFKKKEETPKSWSPVILASFDYKLKKSMFTAKERGKEILINSSVFS